MALKLCYRHNKKAFACNCQKYNLDTPIDARRTIITCHSTVILYLCLVVYLIFIYVFVNIHLCHTLQSIYTE